MGKQDDERVRFLAKLPPDLHRQLKIAAAEQGADMNVLLIAALETALADAVALAEARALSDSLHEARRVAGLPARRQPEDRRVVNHIDGNPHNNDPANLEITDPRGNQ